MARFKSVENVREVKSLNKVVQENNYPFKNVYGCGEGPYTYVNMEAIESLLTGMTTCRDVALIIDISGSMENYYKNKSVEKLITMIVDTVAPYDDDGIDLLFFSSDLVYKTNIKSASEVKNEVKKAMKSRTAFYSTMPTEAFKDFCRQLKSKGRPGTVLFITDGEMDDQGTELKNFYKNVLHKDFKTRDNFYCYAIEFGRNASGALDILDGMYSPEQGPEDLFDLDSADDINSIASVLSQVGGMSAVGSDVPLVATVDTGVIDMVNSDLIEGGMTRIEGPINKIMSFRVKNNGPFNMKLQIPGYNPMTLQVTPRGHEVDIKII